MPSVIALDAMGSDRAPKPEIEGAMLASRQYGVRVLLIGPEAEVKAELDRHPAAARLPIEIVHASEHITMEDKVEAIRAKRDSSMRVGLLSIGEEEMKGNELTREAFQLLKQLPLNFVGNVEGRDLYNGKVDVIVADGFVGNVALKISEGVANLVRTALKESLKATITRQVGALLSRSAFTDFKKRLDHTEYGGAPLLGVKGVCIITHGSSNANAIKNAVRVAAEFSKRGINDSIEKRLAALRPATVASTV